MNPKKQLMDGLFFQNPVTVQLLGMCSTMAITTTLFNGLGMGVSVLIILTLSNILIAALRKIIPNNIRIACFIVVIAGFVTIVDLMLQAFIPALSKSLGLFIPLIVVNCIILGRAEMFASKNGIVDSALDGIGMGIGFTFTLTIMGTIREILGSGTWMSGLDGIFPFLPEGFAIQVLPESIDPFTIMTSAPGGFFVFGIMMAAATWLTTRPKKEKAAAPAEAVEGGNA